MFIWNRRKRSQLSYKFILKFIREYSENGTLYYIRLFNCSFTCTIGPYPSFDTLLVVAQSSSGVRELKWNLIFVFLNIVNPDVVKGTLHYKVVGLISNDESEMRGTGNPDSPSSRRVSNTTP